MSVLLGLGAFAGSFGVSAINNFGLGHFGRGGLGLLALGDAAKRVNNLSEAKTPQDVAYNSFRLAGDGYTLYEAGHYFLDVGRDMNGKVTFNTIKRCFNETYQKGCYDRAVEIAYPDNPEKYWSLRNDRIGNFLSEKTGIW